MAGAKVPSRFLFDPERGETVNSAEVRVNALAWAGASGERSMSLSGVRRVQEEASSDPSPVGVP